MEEEIKMLISNPRYNLLIIIVDMINKLEIEHAETFLKTFSMCKTVIATRSTEIFRYIPHQRSYIVDLRDVQGDFCA